MPSYSIGRATRFEDIRTGQIGFVKFLAEMRLAFALEQAGEQFILVLLEKPIFVGAKKLFCTTFTLSQARDLGFFFLLDDAVVVPDAAALACIDKIGFLSLAPHGQSHLIAVHGGAHEPDQIFIDIASGQTVEPVTTQWYFHGWSVQCPNPFVAGRHMPVYQHSREND